MMRVKLKKNILCPGPRGKFGQRIIKIETGTLYWFDSIANARKKKMIVCKNYERISEYKNKYYDCLSFPKEEFNNLFEVLYEI